MPALAIGLFLSAPEVIETGHQRIRDETRSDILKLVDIIPDDLSIFELRAFPEVGIQPGDFSEGSDGRRSHHLGAIPTIASTKQPIWRREDDEEDFMPPAEREDNKDIRII